MMIRPKWVANGTPPLSQTFANAFDGLPFANRLQNRVLLRFFVESPRCRGALESAGVHARGESASLVRDG